MCRLLGFAAPTPTTLTELIGAERLAAFHDLSRLHADGWGTAWLEDGRVQRVREAAPVRHPAHGASALEDRPSTGRLVHLRLATVTAGRGPVNSHPFLDDGIAFAHNGTISPVQRLEELVGPEGMARVQGSTDSERVLALVRQHVAAGADLTTAAARVTVQLRALFPADSLNAMLLSDRELVAVHSSERSPVPLADLCAGGLLPRQLPHDHLERYYRMSFLRRDDGATVFTSSGIDTSGWTPLPPESIATVDLATLGMRVQPLELAAATALA